MNAELDPFDLAILAILQRDNLRPQREVAEQVNLSPAAVQRRIRRLQDSGVIAAMEKCGCFDGMEKSAQISLF